MLHKCTRNGVKKEMTRKRDAAASLFLDAHPDALHLTPNKREPSTAHHRWQMHTYSLELLMMGIEVPKTC